MLQEISQTNVKNPAATFVPNGAQEEIIRAIGEYNWEEIRHRVIIATFVNGTGKTAVSANILNAIVNGPSSSWFDYPIFRSWPFSKNLRLLGTASNIADGGPVDVEIKRWVKPGTYKRDKAGKDYYSQYFFDRDFKMNVFSNNQDVKEMEGATVGFVWIDEPCTLEQYTAMLSRLRGKGGIILIAATLVGDMADWIEEHLLEKANGENIVHIEADAEANCIEHGIRGRRSHAEIEQMGDLIRGVDEGEYQARVGSGSGSVLTYKVFPRFVSSRQAGVHVISSESFPHIDTLTWYMSVDPHSEKPWAMAWFGVDQQGTYYVLQEWPTEAEMGKPFHSINTSSLGLSDYHRIITNVESRLSLSGRIRQRFMDGRYAVGKEIMDLDRRSLHEILLTEFGLYFSLSSRHRSSRQVALGIIHDLLNWDPDHYRKGTQGTLGAPRLFFHENCTNTIRAFSRHKFKKFHAIRTRATRVKGEREIFKDFIDVMVIGLESLPQWSGDGAYYFRPQMRTKQKKVRKF